MKKREKRMNNIIRLYKHTTVELDFLRKYNIYRFMNYERINTENLLADARAIHFAMKNGAITYAEAKRLTFPLLQRINANIDKIAKKYKRTPRHITFQDLGRNL